MLAKLLNVNQSSARSTIEKICFTCLIYVRRLFSSTEERSAVSNISSFLANVLPLVPFSFENRFYLLKTAVFLPRTVLLLRKTACVSTITLGNIRLYILLSYCLTLVKAAWENPTYVHIVPKVSVY